MKLDNKTLADLIRADAGRYGSQFNRDGTDLEFEKLIDRDLAALNAVADLVECGKRSAARRRWERLDTIAREALSQRAWMALTGGRAFGHEDDAR